MDNALSVALLTDGIWPYVIGGMQKHSYFLCKYLAKNKIKVLLVHSASEINEEINELDCFTPEEKAFITSIIIKKPKLPWFPGHYIVQSYLYSKEIYKHVSELQKVDFIIAKGLTGWYFLNKKRKKHPPIAINIHGYEFMQRKASIKMTLESLMLRFPFRFVNLKADYVFSYGGKISDYIRDLGVCPAKIIEIPSGIEEEWMGNNDFAPGQHVRFVFIGRYERRKGVEELNYVIKGLSSKYNFSFTFVGPIPEKKRLLTEGVEYKGVLRTKEELQKILSQSDVLVCPSYSEGMPNVILEGMANYCAVIATDVGAVSLLVNDQNGWLIPPASTTALKDALTKAIACSESELRYKKQAAYDTISTQFLWKDVIQRLILSIRNVV
ncbi:MAG: glycosyltransferase family 4 protein [Sphingobacteriales bacterium]|nr:glycosyltransferase family 4 protein [Sphingobacteriales bacterium]OJY81038.1 MAG: hypothetical protein BGP14_07365 [Sphingobacteriales bacterium 44-15]